MNLSGHSGNPPTGIRPTAIPNLSDMQNFQSISNPLEREQDNIELRKIYQWINELSW